MNTKAKPTFGARIKAFLLADMTALVAIGGVLIYNEYELNEISEDIDDCNSIEINRANARLLNIDSHLSNLTERVRLLRVEVEAHDRGTVLDWPKMKAAYDELDGLHDKMAAATNKVESTFDKHEAICPEGKGFQNRGRLFSLVLTLILTFAGYRLGVSQPKRRSKKKGDSAVLPPPDA